MLIVRMWEWKIRGASCLWEGQNRSVKGGHGRGGVKWIVGCSCPCPLCPLLACHCPCELQVQHMHGGFWVWVGSLNMIFNHSKWEGIVSTGRGEGDGKSM